MKCRHECADLQFRSATGAHYGVFDYSICKKCGNLKLSPEGASFIAHYYPDRFVAVLDRLKTPDNSAVVDISDLWTGNYPFKKCAHLGAIPRFFFSDAVSGQFRYMYLYCPECGKLEFDNETAAHLGKFYNAKIPEVFAYLRSASCLDISEFKTAVSE